MRLADEVALVLAVQSGLLDALSLPAVMTFREGMSGALDRGAADAVTLIQQTGTLDEPHKQSLSRTLRQHATAAAAESLAAGAGADHDGEIKPGQNAAG